MTKYVLNSGGMSNNPDGARRFFAELVKDTGATPCILMVHVAQPREDWEEKYSKYIAAFDTFMPEGVKPTYELAFPDTLQKQIDRADIIYCPGGDDHLVRYWFEKLGIINLWQGKVVGTNSASTHVLSTCFWTCDWRQIMDGLGVLPIKTIAHYDSAYGTDDPRGSIDWDKAKSDLQNYGDTSLPMYALPEGEFVVLEV